MPKFACLLVWLLYASCCWSDELTATEMKWLRAGWPVLEYAKSQQLPIDIIVQPEAKPGDVPFMMAMDNGRCQLVLSMRGNPNAEATLTDVAAEQVDLLIEAMTAHEVAHCWRYTHGIWHTLPAGFVERSDATGQDNKISQLKQQMRETRREEGFADLVALAWTLRTHPEQYAAVHTWLERIRKDQPVAGAHHDTRVWIELARDGAVFSKHESLKEELPKEESPFEQVSKVWVAGLFEEEVQH